MFIFNYKELSEEVQLRKLFVLDLKLEKNYTFLEYIFKSPHIHSKILKILIDYDIMQSKNFSIIT